MSGERVYHRKVYYDIEKSMQQHGIIGLVGPRQIGKTYALKQLKENHGGEYINFKSIQNVDVTDDILSDIYDIVRSNKECNLYLDEITYLDDFEQCLSAIAEQATMTISNARYNIVITGSQQVYIENAISIAFGARATVHRMDFISFSEFYEYVNNKKLTELSAKEIIDSISEEDYLAYLFSNKTFNCMSEGIDVYLRSCLDETLQSNYNSSFRNKAVNVEEIDIQDLKAVTYTIITCLLDRISSKKLADYSNIMKKVRTNYNQRAGVKEAVVKINRENFENAVNSSVLQNYRLKNRLPKDKMLDCVRFLYQCRLVNITVYNEDSKQRLYCFMNGNYDKWENADSFFDEYGITFGYPHFFVAILSDICEKLEVKQADILFGAVYGALFECTIKGQLAIRYGQPLNTAQQLNDNGAIVAEVDYFNDEFAMEISIRNKSVSELHFGKFDFGNRTKILTTKDIMEEKYGVLNIPYYFCQMALENKWSIDDFFLGYCKSDTVIKNNKLL